MEPWPQEATDRITRAESLTLTVEEGDGSPGEAVPLGFVTVAGGVYVRAYRGPRSTWFRLAQRTRRGRVILGGVEQEVVIEPTAPDLADAIDAAYRSKYRHYPAEVTRLVTGPTARASTLRLSPRRL